MSELILCSFLMITVDQEKDLDKVVYDGMNIS